MAKNLEPDPYDEWDKKQDEYHEQYASKSYNNYSPYAYGTNDLNYYGNFSTVPGYGTLWQPYFAGAGSGSFHERRLGLLSGLRLWLGFGYPWGWTPYHYGSWVYVPAYGWGWQPSRVAEMSRPKSIRRHELPTAAASRPGRTNYMKPRPDACPVGESPGRF